MDPSRPVLVLFCKEPRLGYGKQRLAVSIGKPGALRIARALIDCALEDAVAWDGSFVLSPASGAELAWATSLSREPAFLQKDVRVMAQIDGNLGARIADVDTRLRQMGATRVVFMGSDAPLLDNTHYDTVISTLAGADIVLADGDDGGVTLMASRSGWPDLEALPWSTPLLGDALAASCKASGLKVHRFDGGFDIDKEEDALRMIEFLSGDNRPARKTLNDELRNAVRETG